MNRNFKDYVADGRNFLLSQHHRRGQSLNGISRDSTTTTTTTDENLDLFSRSRRSISLSSTAESDALALKLGKISIGPVKVTKSGMDELLTSTDGGKHDYDWLLTPPETPLCPYLEGNEFQPRTAAPRTSSAARSVSATKASRLSNTYSESNHSTRPARSSSVNSTYSNRSSSILNTSSASVSSYIRPSSPVTRSSSITRPTTPSRTTSQPATPSRTTTSRPSTPSRGVRTAPAPPSTDRSRPSVSSRPSTPSSRPQIAATPSNSRPSTPSRRNPVVTSSPSSNYTASTGRVLSGGRSQSMASHPRSPGPRVQLQQQPVVPPDFSLDRPPNLRTSLPSDRPVSAGRSRPGASAKVKMESPSSVNLPRRPSSPIVSRGRSVESPVRGRQHANGHNTGIAEPRKSSYSDSSMRKPLVKSSVAAENNGFGRNISKKSLDMAIRHMDIRNGPGSLRNLPSTTLYPQSVRSSTAKAQMSAHVSCNSSSVDSNESLSISSSNMNMNGSMSENGKPSGANYGLHREDGRKGDSGRVFARVSEIDIFESSRYDTMLLTEDVKNTNWLHSMEGDNSDQNPIFDNGFEALPEPFSLS